eukprot:scaffold5653_cov147-Cylindrotheca_fusiformis.AAC.23
MPRHASSHKLPSHGALSLSSLSLKKKGREETRMSDIFQPHENDVLMGRGGRNNQHVGNEQLRVLARKRCDDYVKATKKGKSIISKELVRMVREMNPPGRCVQGSSLLFDSGTTPFLVAHESCIFVRRQRKCVHGGLILFDYMYPKSIDVGNDIAREKTSQVLRDAVAYQTRDDGCGSKCSREGKSTAVAKRASRKRRDDAENDEEGEYLAGGVRQYDYHEVRSPNLNHHPYLSLQPSSLSLDASTPSLLPVTPASMTDARKRPRYYESPLPSYQSTPNHYLNTPAHPLGVMLSPPPRGHVFRPNLPYYPTPTYSYQPLQSPRPSNPHYVQSSTNRPTIDPVVLEEETSATTTTAAEASQGDFDLFNGELLSDHSTRGDGALSPSAYSADL